MSLIKDIGLIPILLSVFITRAVLLGSGFGDSLMVLGLCGIYAFQYYHSKKDEDFKTQITRDKKEILDEVNKLKDMISGMKLASGMRKINESGQASNQRRF